MNYPRFYTLFLNRIDKFKETRDDRINVYVFKDNHELNKLTKNTKFVKTGISYYDDMWKHEDAVCLGSFDENKKFSKPFRGRLVGNMFLSKESLPKIICHECSHCAAFYVKKIMKYFYKNGGYNCYSELLATYSGDIFEEVMNIVEHARSKSMKLKF